MVDLHTHTTASDGTLSPKESVMRAIEKGLKAMAITDHDTVEGIGQGMIAGEQYGLEVIPGIEISSVDSGQDIHVLGYYINVEDKLFLSRLSDLQNVRNKRNEMIISNLIQLGIPITLDEVAQKSKMVDGNIGRPHIAEVLMDKGIIGSMDEAFQIYLGRTGKAYANPPRISPEEAIQYIKDAGGVPVLAHPGLYGNDPLIHRLIKNGLMGIEVYHTDHSQEQESHFKKIADQFDLIKTAGSDFHGVRNGVVFHGEVGSKTVSYDTVIELRKAAANIREQS